MTYLSFVKRQFTWKAVRSQPAAQPAAQPTPASWTEMNLTSSPSDIPASVLDDPILQEIHQRVREVYKHCRADLNELDRSMLPIVARLLDYLETSAMGKDGNLWIERAEELGNFEHGELDKYYTLWEEYVTSMKTPADACRLWANKSMYQALQIRLCGGCDVVYFPEYPTTLWLKYAFCVHIISDALAIGMEQWRRASVVAGALPQSSDSLGPMVTRRLFGVDESSMKTALFRPVVRGKEPVTPEVRKWIRALTDSEASPTDMETRKRTFKEEHPKLAFMLL